MLRFNRDTGQYIENDKQDVFIEELIAVCKKHDMSICHDDFHSLFVIHKHHENHDERLRKAHDGTIPPPPIHVAPIEPQWQTSTEDFNAPLPQKRWRE